MLCRRSVKLRELPQLLRLFEDPFERCEPPTVPGGERERSLEVRHRRQRIAEDVAEESAGLEKEFCGQGRLHRLQSFSLRGALEGERELTQPSVALYRGIEALPGVGGQSAARERCKHRVDELLLVVDLRLEREVGRV